MEESLLVRCDSLDTASLSERDLMTPVDPLTYSTEAPDPPLGPEPTPAELAQCEAEVGTLLSIIAELNKKMGSLKAPSDPGESRPTVASRPLVPDLLSHRVKHTERKTPEAASSKPAIMDRGGSVVWSRLQDVLSSVEDSISCRRSWAAPIAAVDLNKHREHLRAAHESSAKARLILEDMEREFGISCSTDFQEEVSEFPLSALQNQQGELERAHSISLVDEDRHKLLNLHRSWRSGRHSPSYRPGAMSCPGSVSPDWASPPFPGSPLLQRRSTRAPAPLCGAADVCAPGSGNSTCTSPTGPEAETERLHRLFERLKSRNERLSLALERRKSEAELMNLALNRLESDCSTLQLGLRYSEECEEAYAELLSLYELQTLRDIPDGTHAAEEAGDAPNDLLDTEELSTSFSTAGGADETQTQRTPEEERALSLRQHIERLRRERASLSLPKARGALCKLIPDRGPALGSPALGSPALGSCSGHSAKERPSDKKEKASLFYELISVREEMSDLRALIRLKEKELRCIEWSLMAQKAQDAAGAFIPEREEPEEPRTQHQRLSEAGSTLGPEGDLSRPILKELQAVLHREQALKKRLALVQESLSTESGAQRRDGGEVARLTQAHSKALSSYRQIRRKYREHVWRLEQKVAAMVESREPQSVTPELGHSSVSPNATANPDSATDWRREETVL